MKFERSQIEYFLKLLFLLQIDIKQYPKICFETYAGGHFTILNWLYPL